MIEQSFHAHVYQAFHIDAAVLVYIAKNSCLVSYSHSVDRTSTPSTMTTEPPNLETLVSSSLHERLSEQIGRFHPGGRSFQLLGGAPTWRDVRPALKAEQVADPIYSIYVLASCTRSGKSLVETTTFANVQEPTDDSVAPIDIEHCTAQVMSSMNAHIRAWNKDTENWTRPFALSGGLGVVASAPRWWQGTGDTEQSNRSEAQSLLLTLQVWPRRDVSLDQAQIDLKSDTEGGMSHGLLKPLSEPLSEPASTSPEPSSEIASADQLPAPSEIPKTSKVLGTPELTIGCQN